MTDDRLQELVRAAMPPVTDGGRARNVWPALVERLDRRTSWSLFDFGLAAAVAVALLVFPEWLWFLLYHL